MDLIEAGNYLKGLALAEGISDDSELARLSSLSASTVNRIMRGKQKATPETLKKMHPHLGVSYEHLMVKFGYIEEIIDHGKYTEHVFTNIEGELVDIVQRYKELPDVQKQLVNTAFRAAKELSKEDIDKLDEYANMLLEKAKKK